MASSHPNPPPITLRGAFSSISGLTFTGAKLKNGKELIDDNLFNIEVEEVQKSDDPKAVIRARMFRTTNVTETPYLIEFEVHMVTRQVMRASLFLTPFLEQSDMNYLDYNFECMRICC